jgi:hypothetical protein
MEHAQLSAPCGDVVTAVAEGRVRTERPALGVVRCGLIALAALGLIGAATELAGQGTGGFLHLGAWLGLGLLAASIVLFAVPSARSLPWIRVLCLVVLGVAAYDVAAHVLAGDAARGIDESITDYWASLSPLTRSLYGADDLGPGTRLAPGMLGQAALLLLLATLGGRKGSATV